MATASSSTSGFFQALPTLEPQYTSPKLAGDVAAKAQDISDDPVFARAVRQYLPPQAIARVEVDMHNLSRRVLLPSTLAHGVDAETNVPTLKPLSTFGEVNKNDPLWTTEGWKALKAIGIEEGVISKAYDASKTGHNRRFEQMTATHLWHHTSTLTMCPMSMTDGAATLMWNHRNDSDGDQPGRGVVFAEAYKRLISSDPSYAWTSGQWMTERSGGSDVRGTETIARRMTGQEIAADKGDKRDVDAFGLPLGPWLIDGFKWFSSATDSDMTVLLAQTTNGLSAFMVPMRRAVGSKCSIHAPSELNGIRIQRLKNKMGTKGLPTAELELKGTRGWLVGDEGKGVKEISALLNITRMHTAAGANSYWSRGLAICRAYSKVRKTRGKFLYENLQHSYWMAGETVKYWASTQFGLFGAVLMGCSEQGYDVLRSTPSAVLIPQDIDHINALLRLLTPVMKAQCSLGSVEGMRASMECIGGVGYCENNEDGGILNVAKIFRDAVVNVIWEGTVSVMADDVARVIKDKRIAGGKILEKVYAPWVRIVLRRCRVTFPTECDVVEERLQALITLNQDCATQASDMEYSGREFLEHLEALTSSVLLLHDANTDGDEVASLVASRYVWSKAIRQSQYQRKAVSWKTEAAADRKIFLGAKYAVAPQGKL